MTMTLVETITVGSGGAASIEFTSIPQDGTDLVVVLSLRSTRSGAVDDVSIRFNNTTTGQSGRTLSGSASVGSYVDSSLDFSISPPAATATANTFGNATIYLTNYTASTNKSMSIDSVSENNATSASKKITAGVWANSAAITSVKFQVNEPGVNIVENSTVSLYKITKA